MPLIRYAAVIPLAGEKYYLTNEAGEQFGKGTYITDQTIQHFPEDEWVLTILDAIPLFATPVYSVLCIIAATLLFYRSKLKIPLSELSTASRKIAESDLNFHVSYKSSDEMGKLCASYEIMRSSTCR